MLNIHVHVYETNQHEKYTVSHMVSFILVGKVIILVKYGLRSNRTSPVDTYVPNYQKSKILIHFKISNIKHIPE